MTDLTLRPLRFTDDVPAMTAWALGHGLATRTESLRGGWADLVAGGGGMLAVHDSGTSDTRQPPGRTVLSFECDDAEAVADRLRGSGFEAAVYDEGYGRVVSLVAPDGTHVLGDERQGDLHGYRESSTGGADPHLQVGARVVTPDVDAYRRWLQVLGLHGVELVEGPIQPAAPSLGPDGVQRLAAVARLLLTRVDDRTTPGGTVLDADGEQVLARPAAEPDPDADDVHLEPLDLLTDQARLRALQTLALRTVSDVTGVGEPGEEIHYPAHSARPGFAAVAAWRGSDLVGFGYGYREPPGSWWDEWVRPHLAAAGRERLLDHAFVIVQLIVDPVAHRTGTGSRLVEVLLAGRREPRVLLTTQTDPNPALGFYTHLGFERVADGPVHGGAGFVVLAREPLAGEAHAAAR